MNLTIIIGEMVRESQLTHLSSTPLDYTSPSNDKYAKLKNPTNQTVADCNAKHSVVSQLFPTTPAEDFACLAALCFTAFGMTMHDLITISSGACGVEGGYGRYSRIFCIFWIQTETIAGISHSHAD